MADPRLAVAIARLEQARRRRRLASMLAAAVWSGVVAAASLALLALASAVIRPIPVWQQLAIGGGGFPVILALALVHALRRTPGLTVLARAADRAFGLDERLSTALEVAGPTDAVRAALITDAASRAVAIEPRRLAPIGLPRAAWAIPGMLLLTTALYLAPPPVGQQASAEPPALSAGEIAETAANLRRIAELMSEAAEQRHNPYLGAVARTLERLSVEVPRTGRTELSAALEGLLEQALEAQAPAELAAVLDATLDALAAEPQPPPAPAAERPIAAGAEPRASAGELLAELQARAERRLAPAPGGRMTGEMGSDYWEGMEVSPEADFERMLAARAQMLAAQLVGAAQDAGREAGDQAGHGVQPLDGPAGELAAFGAAAQVALPEQPERAGRRIRIEVAPSAEAAAVERAADAAGGWQRQREHEVSRQPLSAADRELVRRYFRRQAE